MIAAIIARLQLSPMLNLVAGAADFALAAESRPGADPAASPVVAAVKKLVTRE